MAFMPSFAASRKFSFVFQSLNLTGSLRNIVLKSTIAILLLASGVLNAQVNFSYQSSWKWLKGSEASALPAAWKDQVYDDSSWHTGNAPFRYGDGTGGTELTDMLNGYSTVFLRSVFTCSQKNLIKVLTLYVDYDDGFIIWINGAEALRINAPSSPAWNALAPTYHESGTAEKFVLNAQSLNLIDGINTIAVQGFNVNLNSSDFYFDLHMSGEPDIPELQDTIGVSYSLPSGFYNDPFTLTITSPYPSTKIAYTLDGSNPQSSTTGFLADSPATVFIDPESTTGRGKTPAVTIRASVAKSGYKPAKPVPATYIFLEKVKRQSYPGGGWPSGDINGQSIDLAMDSKIVDNPAYSGLMNQSLKDIPSISIITGLGDLFDPSEGIYVNAEGHGLNWEKECSVELIPGDGTSGFRINAGLRIRGGWSRHGDFPKHAFRLFFRSDYGAAKLHYPLFGDEGASEFDKIDLRCEENYAWSNGSPNNSLVREVFSRDSQRDMGEPYTRSRYYHLYVDGMYWGVYQTQERSEASYASTYFGGSKDDYDVVKVNTENYSYNIEATDGNLSSWQKIWNMCSSGFTSNADYFAIEGKDLNGKPVKGSEVLVNIDNLIDYMLVIFYTGNFDAPTSSFGGNKGCNNFFAIDDRTDKSKGFVFFAHDSEHSMFDEAHPPGVGIYEDRVNLANRTDGMDMLVSSFNYFHPQWLHYKLSANEEYRSRFADRAYKAFKPGGVFSESSALARVNKRIDEVSMAVIAESARWGDAKTGSTWAYNKNDSWLPEITKIRNGFIPYRSAIVINQLEIAGLYSSTLAPQFFISSIQVTEPQVILNSVKDVRIRNLNNSGTIYYTYDGSDPRLVGGEASASARSSTSDVILKIGKSTTLKARVLYNGSWSPLEEVCFVNPAEDYSKLRITEISYHPKEWLYENDTISGKDLEFLEFKNTGKYSVNMAGVSIDSAVSYSFPSGSVLPPGQFYVVASKPKYFYDYYGMIASGNYKGNLSNSGEEILLKAPAGNKLMDFQYLDSYPWPSKADGEGYTLSAAVSNPAGDPADPKYWIASSMIGGSPFADNSVTDPVPVSDQNSYLAVYPNPTSGLININLVTDDEIDEMDLQIMTATGKVIYKAKVPNPGTFDLASLGLPSGIYFLKSDNLPAGSTQRIVLMKH